MSNMNKTLLEYVIFSVVSYIMLTVIVALGYDNERRIGFCLILLYSFAYSKIYADWFRPIMAPMLARNSPLITAISAVLTVSIYAAAYASGLYGHLWIPIIWAILSIIGNVKQGLDYWYSTMRLTNKIQ
jgi:hypothetical protein